MPSEASRVRFAYSDDDRPRTDKANKGYRQQHGFVSDSEGPVSPGEQREGKSPLLGSNGLASTRHRSSGSGGGGGTNETSNIANGSVSNNNGSSSSSNINNNNNNGSNINNNSNSINNTGNGTGEPWPQRPTGPARTLSNTYQPQRRPTPQSSFPVMGGGTDGRTALSKPRVMTGGSAFRAQEREYVKRLRERDYASGYFDHLSGTVDGQYADSDSEGETPSSEGPHDDRYDQEAIMFYNYDDLHPTEEDIRDASNRERLEWHGMLEAVLTGDVVRQEKKRLTGAAEQPGGKTAQKAELWLGVRARICGRHIPVQRRLTEDARTKVDRMIDEIINFRVEGVSDAGKPAAEQVSEVIATIDKAESLYPTRAAFLAAHKTAATALYEESCDTIVSWSNVSALINTELGILRKWVGNDELDFTRARDKTPGSEGSLSDDTSFLDRLLKEEGLRSLHEHYEEEGRSRRGGMLEGISRTVVKAKETLVLRATAFRTRHLPSHVEDLLTLISFPSRLMEEVVQVRLAYAKRMKESAQQNVMMQDQMIAQFQVLLKLAIKIKQEYVAISQAEAGWELPPWIDESFDMVVLDALKYYFKMLNWKLSSNRNTFREAELLFQEWEFANEIGSHLVHGDVEVAEQFSSLTFKALSRLSTTFERELQRRPRESVADMSRRYKQLLDGVRVRQRMLQRFSRSLSDNYENACDLNLALDDDGMELFLDRLAETGHFQVYSRHLDEEGVLLVASPSLAGRLGAIESMMSRTAYEQVEDDLANPYVLILRPEGGAVWYGPSVEIPVREEPLELKTGHLRLVAGGSQVRLVLARKAFFETADVQLDLVIEQRSNLKKVHAKMTDIRRTAYKLSNTFMDSVEKIRRQTAGENCQDLIQTCFVFATEFGQRSASYMDSNRRQMSNMKLTKLALDWVNFICVDCQMSDKRTFRWAVVALEFTMSMTRGRHILGLTEPEYERLRYRVSGCMSLLISHFDVMGARSTVALQAERQRLESSLSGECEGGTAGGSGGVGVGGGKNKANKDMPNTNKSSATTSRQQLLQQLQNHRLLGDEEAAARVAAQRLDGLAVLDEQRKALLTQRSSLGRVLEVSNEVDRSLAYLSSTAAANFTMRWQQGYFVGGGTFGNVYAAMNLDNGQVMAVKEIRLQDPKLIPSIATQISDEMRVLESLDHPNVVSYYGIEVHRDRVYIFMEYCSGGSLASLLEHGRIEDEQVIMVYALQLLEGLAYLHEIKIAHRDIKPENILLDHNGIIKYVDFGAAKVIARHGRTFAFEFNMAEAAAASAAAASASAPSPSTTAGTAPIGTNAVSAITTAAAVAVAAASRPPPGNGSMTGTPMYMSPEVIKGETASGHFGAMDVWSLGCVILEMATGRRPWGNLDNEWAIMYSIAQGSPPQLPTADQLSPQGIDFLRCCFRRDPRQRATAVELLQHEWIMGIRNLVVEPATPSEASTPSGSTAGI